MNYQVTENFSFDELTNTSHGELLKKNRDYALGLKDNLNLLGILLQDIRDGIGKPITISSAVRCPELNKKVGGVPTSRHTQGLAADIQISGMKASDVFNAVRKLNLPNIQKVILEGVKGKEWVHIQARTATDTKQTAYLETKDGKNYVAV